MYFLSLADLFWSGAALIVDWPKFFFMPVWAYFFAPICPIYPLALAICFWQKAKNKSVNPYLLAFATIGSVVFGAMAIVYYPVLMADKGFAWQDTGQIFWVLFYGLQGVYLIRREKFHFMPIVVTVSYLVGKFILDYRFASFGYLEVERLSGENFTKLFILAIIISIVTGLFAYYKSRKNQKAPNEGAF